MSTASKRSAAAKESSSRDSSPASLSPDNNNDASDSTKSTFIQNVTDLSLSTLNPKFSSPNNNSIPSVSDNNSFSNDLEIRRCSWVILTADDLRFVYLCSPLQKLLGTEIDSFLGTSLYDFLHPNEEHLAKADLTKFVRSRSVHGTVTRCNYLRLDALKNTLSGRNQYIHPQLNPISTDDKWIGVDVATSYIADNLVIAFFHAFKDFDPKETPNFNEWSNCCGSRKDDFTELLQSASLNDQIYRYVGPPKPQSSLIPSRIWLMYEESSKRILSLWPESQSFNLSDVETHHSTPFRFDPHQFLLLVAGESHSPSNVNSIQGDTTCTSRYFGTHKVEIEDGTIRTYESVVIAYGAVTFAVFDQQTSLSSPKQIPLEKSKNSWKKSLWNTTSTMNSNSVGYLTPSNEIRASPSPSEGSLSSLPTMTGITNVNTSNFNVNISNSNVNTSNSNVNISNSNVNTSNSNVNTSNSNVNTSNSNVNTSNSNVPPSSTISRVGKGISTNTVTTVTSVNVSTPSPGGPVRNLKRHNSPRKTSASSNVTDVSEKLSSSSETPTIVTGSGKKACASCGTTTSPEWRRGPTGHKTLCNACGLRYARQIAREGKRQQQIQVAAAARTERVNTPPNSSSTISISNSSYDMYPQQSYSDRDRWGSGLNHSSLVLPPVSSHIPIGSQPPIFSLRTHSVPSGYSLPPLPHHITYPPYYQNSQSHLPTLPLPPFSQSYPQHINPSVPLAPVNFPPNYHQNQNPSSDYYSQHSYRYDAKEEFKQP